MSVVGNTPGDLEKNNHFKKMSEKADHAVGVSYYPSWVYVHTSE